MTELLQPRGISLGFEVDEFDATYPHHNLGVAAEQGANVLTSIRGMGAIALNRHIVNTEDYHSWSAVIAFGGLALTDMDGKFARWGRKRQGKDEDISRPIQSYADHLTDKGLVNGTMAAIAKREGMNGNSLYAGAVATAAGVTTTRDVVTTVDRIVADCQGIDTRAQESGKKKALRQYLVVGFALSPFARTHLGRTVAAASMAYSAKESVTSGWELHKSFTSRRRQRRPTNEF